jgi:hypothetical protein
VLQIVLAMTDLNLMYLLSHLAMFNIFDALNTVHNWDFLWFIPYLLLFMILFCVTEKYLKSSKLQLLVVIAVWAVTVLAWGYDLDLKLGMCFSQYFLVFMTGVWINKLKLYEKATNFKTALAAIPFVVLFSVDISNIFTCSNILETVKYLIYFNGRSIVLSLSAIFVVLFVFRKLDVSRNRFVEAIAKTSIVIYLMEPILSYMIRMYVFGQPAVYLSDGATFYIYQLLRAGTLFVVLPLAVSLIKKRKTMKTVEPQNLHTSHQL